MEAQPAVRNTLFLEHKWGMNGMQSQDQPRKRGDIYRSLMREPQRKSRGATVLIKDKVHPRCAAK